MNGLGARLRLRLNDPTNGLARLGLLLAIWSALVAGALAWNTHRQNQAALSAATAAARATIGKDLSARKWATSHGGVYVPPTEHTPPNPYLNVPDRDVVTSTGQSLTLINPAYMLRQMQSDFPGDYGTRSHITSLKPINPGNAADAWESKALHAFERGSRELLETQQIDGQPYLRVMRPFIVEANCLKCHAQQGYKLGDIRGGISSTVPLAPFLALERESHTDMRLILGAIWLIGLAGLAWMGVSLRRTQRLEIIARSAAAIEESEKRQRLEIDRMPIGYIVWDTDFRVVTWNPAAEKIFSFTADEARGRHPYELIVPKAAQPQVDAVWRRLCAGDETAHSINENTTKDGRTILCSWTNTPLKQSDGTVLGVLSMVQDITERKQKETELRMTAHRLNEAQHVGKMGFLDWDLLTNEIELSDEALRIYGLAPGKNKLPFTEITKRVHPDDMEAAEKGLRNAIETGAKHDIEHRIIRTDGTVLDVHTPAEVIRDANGKAIRVLGTVQDITERKQAELAIQQLNAELEQRVRQRTAELEQKAGELQHSESQMRVMLSSLAEGLIELDEQGRVLLMNPEAERLLRWSGQEVHGRPIGELVRLCDAQGQALPAEASCIERALQWGEVSRDEEQWLQRADGSRFLAALIVSPIVGEGRVKGVVVSFQDISERKLAEHFRNELIARVSHELRTPLAGIQGAAELLRSKKDMAAPKREQLLEIIAADSGRLGALVENFTELRRHLAGEIRYQFEPLALPPLLQAAIARAAQGDTLHRFHLEAPDTLPAIPADAAGINRVLDNLLSNAVKFSPQGGDITVAARSGDGELQVSVRDQGMGIAPEALPKLFTPLFQAEATDTRRFGGAGLGLAMVKAIVEAHGGRVWAESEPGQGSTFYFTLSISPPIAGAASVTPARGPIKQ